MSSTSNLDKHLSALILIILVISLVLSSSALALVRTLSPSPHTAVSVHFKINMDLSTINKLALEAKSLGAEFVRFDIWWNEIMPEQGVIDYDAIAKWGEIIGIVRSYDLKIIAILGPGYGALPPHRYPSWVVDYVNDYYSCLSACYSSSNVPIEITSNYARILNKQQVSDNVRFKIINAMASSLMNFNIDAALSEINFIKEECPLLYRASAKGYLTAIELKSIRSTCPKIAKYLVINRIEYNGEEKIFVKPYPVLEKIYIRWKEMRKNFKDTKDPLTILQAYDPCGCYRKMEELLEYAYQYSRIAAGSFGWDIDYYQLGNELNHPVDDIPAEWDAAFIYALSLGLSSDPSDHIGIVNVFADWINWDSTLRGWLNSLQATPISIIAIDHYPGTWTTTGYDDWAPLDTLINIAQQYNKIPAIMETGSPTCSCPITPYTCSCDENDQVNYVNIAFNSIKSRAQNTYIAFVTWYMLWDEDPVACEYNPYFVIHWWCAWGVLRSDFTRKPGYYALQDWFKNGLKW